jgi:4-hydroxy-tetrahydrodipicolinate reductase
LTAVADQLIACLRAGHHVVSTCEELSYPVRKYPELSQKLDRIAKKNKVALLGTGVNPGFAMDKLPLTLAAACQEVRRVTAHRVVDAAKRRLPLQKKVGAGLTVEQFEEQVKAGIIKHHGLPESVAMVADSLGIVVDRIEEIIRPEVAKTTVRSEFFEVKPGFVVGVHQTARGFQAREESVKLELEMYLGAPNPIDSVAIQGKPDLTMNIPGGIHGDLATAAVAVNCIPTMLELHPGLRTSRDVPMCFFPATS